MADYVITKADVVPTADAVIKRYTAGGAITAGKTVAISTTDSKAYQADATDATIDEVKGIALNDATAGQPVDVQQAGNITVSAVGTAGDAVVMSQTAGGIAPHADLVATNEVSIVGYFTTASNIKLAINNLGIVRG